MPSDWLTIPHFKQSRDGRCLPACARMVLAYFNDPAFDDAPVSVPLQNFLLAWSEFDYEYAVIERL
jgi:hypothetical protein